MSAYTLIIIGTGQHHLGHRTGNPDRDADHQLKQLLSKLQATGQTIHAAAFVVNGVPEILAGKPEDLPMLQVGVNEGKAAEADGMQRLERKIDFLLERTAEHGKAVYDVQALLEARTQPAPEASKGRRPRNLPPGEKKEGGGADKGAVPLEAGSPAVDLQSEGQPIEAAPPSTPPPIGQEDTTGDVASDESGEQVETQE